MQGPRCQQENPPRAKFCLECGARLVLTCAQWHTELLCSVQVCGRGAPLLEQVLEEAHRSGSIGEHALYLAWLSEVRGQELPGKHS